MKAKKEPREFHPYGEYLTRKTNALILGTFPIGKFSNPKRKKEILPEEIDFYYGGRGNHLWKLLGQCFGVSLKSKADIVKFIEKHGFSMADVISSCRRKNGGGSDSDLYDIEWNKNLHDFISRHQFKTIYFTSRKVYLSYIKHIGRVDGPEEIILLSPSANGVRSYPRLKEFIEWNKTASGEKRSTAFRLQFYQKVFNGK